MITFSLLANAYPKKLEENTSNQNQQMSNIMQVLWQVSVSLNKWRK